MFKDRVSNNRFIKVAILIALTGGLIFTGVFLSVHYQTENAKGIVSQNANIIIVTTSGEMYTAKGVLEVIQKGWKQETVMELNGSINKETTVRTPDTDSMKQDKNPAVITVYMDKKIYGFYGSKGFYKDTDKEQYTIVLRGYLEGYADENNYYST